MTKSTMEGSSQTCLVPQPSLSDGIPQLSLRLTDGGSCWKEMDLTDEISFMNSDAFCSRLVLLFLSVCFFVCSVPAPPALSILNTLFSIDAYIITMLGCKAN